ncbi:MAG: GAF domain-containing sensor histidine kinase [Synechococcaceae cyanobacterium SM2_3_60]|nr:GAF domain-containing sensor histidine kinase [Synechococcaceae cyanobacterium SM2_3_60]
MQANLVVPLVHDSQLWGLLIAHHCRSTRTWPTWEIELLQSMGNQIAIAIQQAELYQTIEAFNATLQAQVAERTATLVQVLGFEALLKRITQKIRDSLDEGQILLAVQVELLRALSVRECQTNVRCDTDLPCAPPTYAPDYSLICCIANRISVLVIPIMIAGETPEMLGDLCLIDKPEREFSDLELSLVQQVANQCAIAVRQARLYTAAQQQVRELERLNHLKDDFLSTVSHELRTPLTSMRMSIQMLELTQQEHAFSSKQQEYLRVLHSECQREIALVNDLLELQRLEAAHDDRPLDPLDLRPWLEQHLAATQATREVRKLHLKTSGLADLPGYVWASTLRWERIVQELITNACKYTPPGGTIELKVAWQNSVLTLAIRNTASIPAAELERVFERFYRIPQLDRWQQGGTGLGLALVKQVVEYLGGSISASSDHQWTEFTVHLPASLLAESGARPQPLKTGGPVQTP